MPHTDTSERGLERLICTALTGAPCDPARRRPTACASGPPPTAARLDLRRRPSDYDREYCVDLAQLCGLPARDAAGGRRGARPRPRRPDAAQVPGPPPGRDHQARRRSTCCATASSTARTTSTSSTARPSPGNAEGGRALRRRTASASPASSATAATRRSSRSTSCLFINGLPIATFELKNSLTKQTVDDAVEQYKRDRDPRELLFEFGRCIVHFAVDDHEVRFCTHLKGKASWFLPFNQGWNDGAGNPPNPDGLKTDYLWKRILTRDGPDGHPRELRPDRRDEGREDRQEEAVADLPALPPARRGAQAAGRRAASTASGRRYLIQHSAGSGKSNSIAWLAHQLIGLQQETTRRSSTRSSSSPTAASSTSRSATRSSSSPRWARPSATPSTRATCASSSRAARRSSSPRSRSSRSSSTRSAASTAGGSFAIIIDEAHSSQGGRDLGGDEPWRSSAAGAEEDDETLEDTINRIMEARKLLPNASYFAFTATPKNKTLEIFGEPYAEGGAGQAPALPQLHDEAGDPGGLHPGRAQALHAGRQLLQAGQDGRGRPGVRHEAGAEEAAPLRREPRPRHPAQGRDHGRPFPRAGARR